MNNITKTLVIGVTIAVSSALFATNNNEQPNQNICNQQPSASKQQSSSAPVNGQPVNVQPIPNPWMPSAPAQSLGPSNIRTQQERKTTDEKYNKRFRAFMESTKNNEQHTQNKIDIQKEVDQDRKKGHRDALEELREQEQVATRHQNEQASNLSPANPQQLLTQSLINSLGNTRPSAATAMFSLKRSKNGQAGWKNQEQALKDYAEAMAKFQCKQRKRWRENNPDKAIANAKRWREKNKERARASSKRWREKNLDKVRAKNKRWRENNRDTLKAKWKLSYKNNPDKVRAKNKLWRENNKDKARASVRRWRENNRDKVRANSKRWRKNNPDKVMKYNRQAYKRRREEQLGLKINPHEEQDDESSSIDFDSESSDDEWLSSDSDDDSSDTFFSSDEQKDEKDPDYDHNHDQDPDQGGFGGSCAVEIEA